MTTEPTKQNDSNSKPDDSINAADAWDDIQLTPIKASDKKVISKEQPAAINDVHLKPASDNISMAFKELDDSFMYLGFLKKLPLPEATRFFEDKFLMILKIFEMVWENKNYPEENEVFTTAGEDFSILSKLIHSGDAIQPIYEGIKTVYENVEQFRDSGMSSSDGMEALKEIFKNRK